MIRRFIQTTFVIVVTWLALSCTKDSNPISANSAAATGAQIQGTVAGTVFLNGTPMGGVSITPLPKEVKSLAKGAALQANQVSTGGYTLSLPAGEYRLYFEYLMTSTSGYYTDRSVTVKAGTTVHLDVELTEQTVELYAPVPSGLAVTLDWNTVSAADYFFIHRSADSLVWSQVALTSSSFFVDTVQVAGTYYYRVSYFDQGKELGKSDPVKVVVTNRPGGVQQVSLADQVAFISILATVPNPLGQNLGLIIYRSRDSLSGYSTLDTVKTFTFYYSLSLFSKADSAADTGRYFYRFAVVDLDSHRLSDTSVVFGIRFKKVLPALSLSVSDSLFYTRLSIYPLSSSGIVFPLSVIVWRSYDDSSHFVSLDTLVIQNTNNYLYFRDFGADTGKIYYRVAYTTADGKQGDVSPSLSIIHRGKLGPPSNFIAADSGLFVQLIWYNSYNSFPVVVSRSRNSGPYLPFDTVSCGSSGSYCYLADYPDSAGSYTYRAAFWAGTFGIGDSATTVPVDFKKRLKAPLVALSATAIGTLVGVSAVSGAVQYFVYRSTAPGDFGDNIKILNGTGTFTDTLVQPGNYYYRAVAVDAGGAIGLFSSAQAVSVTLKLSAPGLSLQSYELYVSLSISSVTTAVGYVIYRSNSAPGILVPVDTFYSSSVYSSFTIYDSLGTGGFYYYAVSALASNGAEGERSQTAVIYFSGTLVTPSPPTLTDMGGAVRVNFSSSYAYDTMLIYRSDSVQSGYALVAKLSAYSYGSYYDSLPAAGFYYYKIQRGRGKLLSDFSQTAGIYFSNHPAAPTYLYSYGYSGYIRVYWYPVSGVTGYGVYRGASSAFSGMQKIATIPSPGGSAFDGTYFNYRDSSVTPGAYYYYRVTSENADGESAPSGYASGSAY